MVRIELQSNTKEYVEYRYYPEDKSDYGVIRVYKDPRSIEITKSTEKEWHDWYIRHAYAMIRDFIEKDEYKELAIRAWY